MKKVLIIVSVVLIIAQIISAIGMSRMWVGLYPDGDDVIFYSPSSEDDHITISGYLFGFIAGVDRFISGFEDLTYPEDEYRVPSSTQMTSAMIRESLGCSEAGGGGLAVYDMLVFLGYSLSSLMAIVLLVIAMVAFRSKNNPINTSYLNEDTDNTATNQQKWICPKCGCTNNMSSRSCHGCGNYK